MLSAPPFQVLRAPDAHYTGTHYTVDSRSIEHWKDEIQDAGRSDRTSYLSFPSKFFALWSEGLSNPLLNEKYQQEKEKL